MIQNIYCIGRNYVLHAKELNNSVPAKPLVFSKPTHSLAAAVGDPIKLPKGKGEIHYETELVLKVGRAYEKGLSVDELIDEMTIGIDFTLRDVQTVLKQQGHPWLLAKGFPNAALLGRFIPFPGLAKCKQQSFTLLKNREQVQKGNIQNLIFDLQYIIDYVAEHFGISKGDIIFTGTPEGVGPVYHKDYLQLMWGDTVLGESEIHI
ncbi:fumarylacetoacetate hydrolase family protein [Salirhabdus salicampi]|uniref:fumarylacetoacetate hydrolase family protein n=1 Tax=Salirhabdus salicampi TaxID=476102 RepID=UPI0020C2D186|nr:fumarylacetoacetate hydrolase family protein [Salirhabdus salicampi]MCP8615716.1 fumarylacetoacetate hydrolase family protein [Salirhabdus salicampi]